MTNLQFAVSFWILALLGFITGCDQNMKNSEKTGASYSHIEIKVGERGEEFAARYPELVRVDSQPAGLSFFKINWNAASKGVVVLSAGAQSFEVSDVLSVTGTQDQDITSEGMAELQFVAGWTGANGITHQEARERLFRTFDYLRSRGWKPLIPLSAPRLSGKDLVEYAITTKRQMSLDASYKPSIEDWMRFENTATWELYTDDAFVSISFHRDRKQMDPAKPGAYVVNYEITSAVQYFKGFVDPGERENWKAALPVRLKEAADQRSKIERELVQQGFRINSEYVDPSYPTAR